MGVSPLILVEMKMNLPKNLPALKRKTFNPDASDSLILAAFPTLPIVSSAFMPVEKKKTSRSDASRTMILPSLPVVPMRSSLHPRRNEGQCDFRCPLR